MNYSRSKLSYRKQLKKFRANLNKLSRYQLGYLAGLIDADGSIGLYIDKRKDGTSITNRVTVVSNTDKRLVRQVAEWLGDMGCFYKVRDANKYGENRKALWSYLLQRREAGRYLLKRLMPHLISKKEKAKKFIKFVELRRGRKYQPYNKEELDLVRYFKKSNKIGAK